jgi:hypothetical protein
MSRFGKFLCPRTSRLSPYCGVAPASRIIIKRILNINIEKEKFSFIAMIYLLAKKKINNKYLIYKINFVIYNF